ncbi:MAG: DUF4131 domain-containing protein, partial [Anaerolineales bacterium]
MPLLWLSLAFLAGILLAANLPPGAPLWLILTGLALLLVLLRSLGLRLVVDAPGVLRWAVSTLPLRLTFSILRIYSRLARLGLRLPLYALPLAAAFGELRYQVALPDLDDPTRLAYYNHPETVYIVEGVLLSPPEVRDRYTSLYLQASRLRALDADVEHSVRGKLLVTDWDQGNWRYGDRLRLQGVLETPPEGESFSYRQYLAR